MATAKKTDNICWKECLERETLYAADWYGPLRSISVLLKNLKM